MNLRTSLQDHCPTSLVFPIRKLLLLVLLGVAFLAVAPLSVAQPRFDGAVLSLPVADDYPQLYSLELRITDGTFPVEFTFQSSGSPHATLSYSSPYFEGDLLVIPVVYINGFSYWAELKEISSSLYRLEGYGRNPGTRVGDGSYQHEGWDRLPGKAKDIGIGADGTVWAVGVGDYRSDYGLYHWNGSRWLQDSGSAIRVDVDPWGNPWVINSNNEIFRLEKGRWVRVPGYAQDIGIGADGSVWAIGTNSRRGGYGIYTYTAQGWRKVDGAGVRIDVAPDGTPWIVNDDDEIYRLNNGSWQRMPGYAKDIGIGADGSIWSIGTDGRTGGYGVYRFTGSAWQKQHGSGAQISVGPDGAPWIVNREGEIYRGYGY
jgi:hypothetical protein